MEIKNMKFDDYECPKCGESFSPFLSIKSLCPICQEKIAEAIVKGAIDLAIRWS